MILFFFLELFCSPLFLFLSSSTSFSRQFILCVEPSKLNHTIWVTSVFFILSVFNLVSIVLPLASEFVWLAYKIYLAIAMCHFVDLTMAWYGGETTMLSHVNNGEDEEKINFRYVSILG